MQMRSMHAIEVSHGQQRRAEVGGNIVEFVEDLHGKLLIFDS